MLNHKHSICDYSKTVANKCRWGDLVGLYFNNDVIIWDNSENGYQGRAEVIGVEKSNLGYLIIKYFTWNYGSCSLCDSWDSMEETDILSDIKNNIITFHHIDHFIKWVKMTTFSLSDDNDQLCQKFILKYKLGDINDLENKWSKSIILNNLNTILDITLGSTIINNCKDLIDAEKFMKGVN